MALTLTEAAKLSNNIVLQGVVETIVSESPVLQDSIRRVLEADVSLAIFLTGVGTATVFEAAARMQREAELRKELAGAIVVVRGPKPTAVLRKLGVRIDLTGIAAGWLALAIGMYVSTVQLDTLISFQSATVLRLIQSVGLGLLFVPVTMAGYIGMPAEKADSVAGIINFMRNIGSSVGTSMVTTLLARRAQVHQVALSQHTTRFDRSVQNQVKALSLQLVYSGSSAADAHKRAYGLLYRAMRGQVETLAYIDIFWVLTFAASIMFLLAFIVRSARQWRQPQRSCPDDRRRARLWPRCPLPFRFARWRIRAGAPGAVLPTAGADR